MKIRNAEPKIFYGLHFQSGVAEYKDLDGQPMIYINPDTAKGMDRSFQGRPVFVEHADEVDFHDVQSADGVVVRSFYNKADGNHWAEFLVYTDEGLSKIGEGWKLSNAYEVTEERGSGNWHGVDYDREVANAEYEHLAIVPNPRYADSIILSAEEFKQYNLDKEAELLRLANSKGDKVMNFTLFKKEKVKNSKELADMSVTLPKSKVEKTITQLVNEADEKEESKGIANMSDEVEVDKDKKMSVENLLDFYKKNCKNESDDEDIENEDDEDIENEDDEDIENEGDDKDLENEDDEDIENEDDEDIENEDDEDLENESDEEEEPVQNKKKKNMKKNSKKTSKKKTGKISNARKIANAKEAARVAAENYTKLANAHKTVEIVENSIDLGQDKVERGTSRYGSNK